MFAHVICDFFNQKGLDTRVIRSDYVVHVYGNHHPRFSAHDPPEYARVIIRLARTPASRGSLCKLDVLAAPWLNYLGDININSTYHRYFVQAANCLREMPLYSSGTSMHVSPSVSAQTNKYLLDVQMPELSALYQRGRKRHPDDANGGWCRRERFRPRELYQLVLSPAETADR